jgi:inner membrane transporter RhtA
VIGFLALSQVPNGIAVVGILLVVAAGIGAERTGARADTLAQMGHDLLGETATPSR